MILTVTLNPSIDKTFHVPLFAVNRLNRADMPFVNAGGKGVNASVFLKLLGEDVVATGFLGGLPGRHVAQFLREKGVTTHFTQIEGTTRTNYIVLDKRRQTQINEMGPRIEKDELEQFINIYDRTLSLSEFVIMAGSIPPGVDSDIYKKLADKARNRNIKVFVNTYGEFLERAIEAAPYIVKPDIRSGEKILGLDLDSLKNKIKVAKKIISNGSKIVLFSEGLLGQLIVTEDRAFIAWPKKESFTSRIGVQDSVISVFAYGVKAEMDLEDIARMAICAGQSVANIVSNTPENMKEIEACRPDIRIEVLE